MTKGFKTRRTHKGSSGTAKNNTAEVEEHQRIRNQEPERPLETVHQDH